MQRYWLAVSCCLSVLGGLVVLQWALCVQAKVDIVESANDMGGITSGKEPPAVINGHNGTTGLNGNGHAGMNGDSQV